MTGSASALARVGLAAVLVAGAAVLVAPAAAWPGTPAAADDPMPSRVLFSFADNHIYESSGLVDTGSLVLTTNDSGDRARLFAVDPRTGRTRAVVEYADDVQDVEALAPGRGGAVWVGDIGDNRARRSSVSVYRTLPGAEPENAGTVPAQRFDLVYPDGPRDAEALLAQPGDDRLFVVSKSPLGGTVYAAPTSLRPGSNRLRPFATVGGLVTDGAFLPGGDRVLLRTYGTASVYTFPDFRLVGTVRLPAQPQGEGLSVGPDGRVLISSEGVHSDVLEVRLPEALLHGDPGPAAGPPTPDQQPRAAPAHRDARDWLGIGLVAAGVLGLGWLSVRASRPRTPRSR